MAAHRDNSAGLFRYIRIMDWARERYTVGGILPLTVQGEPAAYRRIENAAWDKYVA